METLNAFFEKIRSDKNLQKKVAEFAEKEDTDGMIAFAKENGVLDEDIEKMDQLQNDFKSQLTDEELETVAGGYPNCRLYDSYVSVNDYKYGSCLYKGKVVWSDWKEGDPYTAPGEMPPERKN